MVDFLKPIQKTVYSDLSLKFDAHPVSGKIKAKTNIEAIKQALKNLVLMNKYEAHFQPNLYGGVRELLFENIENDTVLQRVLETQVETVINTYEPRAVLNELIVSVDSETHGVNLEIYFTPINHHEPLKISVFLARIR